MTNVVDNVGTKIVVPVVNAAPHVPHCNKIRRLLILSDNQPKNGAPIAQPTNIIEIKLAASGLSIARAFIRYGTPHKPPNANKALVKPAAASVASQVCLFAHTFLRPSQMEKLSSDA